MLAGKTGILSGTKTSRRCQSSPEKTKCKQNHSAGSIWAGSASHDEQSASNTRVKRAAWGELTDTEVRVSAVQRKDTRQAKRAVISLTIQLLLEGRNRKAN